jgi:hypothetical protein
MWGCGPWLWVVCSGAMGHVVGGRQGGDRWERALHWTMRSQAVEFGGDAAVHRAVLLGDERPCDEGSVSRGEGVVQQMMVGDAVV